MWRRDLGKANSKHIKLDHKSALLESADHEEHTDDGKSSCKSNVDDRNNAVTSYEETCSICSLIIPNF